MAEQCRRLLTEQPITPAGPGSIRKDVESFLEFVGSEGIATKSRSNSLPIGRLMELNQKSSYPIESVEDARCKFKQPKVAESVCKAPDQYPSDES